MATSSLKNKEQPDSQIVLYSNNSSDCDSHLSCTSSSSSSLFSATCYSLNSPSDNVELEPPHKEEESHQMTTSFEGLQTPTQIHFFNLSDQQSHGAGNSLAKPTELICKSISSSVHSVLPKFRAEGSDGIQVNEDSSKEKHSKAAVGKQHRKHRLNHKNLLPLGCRRAALRLGMFLASPLSIEVIPVPSSGFNMFGHPRCDSISSTEDAGVIVLDKQLIWTQPPTPTGSINQENTDPVGDIDFYSNIENAADPNPGRKFTSKMNDIASKLQKSKLQNASASLPSRQYVNDNILKNQAYRAALQAILYPTSCNRPHTFQIWSATKPTYCYECGVLLWGLARQGLRCIHCGVRCHEKCRDLLNADCLQREAEKCARHGTLDKTQTLMRAMYDLMQKRINQSTEAFQLLSDAFKKDKTSHDFTIKRVQQMILEGTSKWSAKIAITVQSAQGLLPKDKEGFSDPYVTVQIGKVKRRTKTISKNLNPVWNETFYFECQNILERIKIRVWDEDDDLKSRIRQKFINESDDFLGQAMVDVRTLTGEMDVWYSLQKRTDRSAVSGAIRLRISVEIKGEEAVAPYHIQYTCLHEILFHHLFEQNVENSGRANFIVTPSITGNESKHSPSLNSIFTALHEDQPLRYFEGPAQEIIQEFASRFGVERIYQTMTHCYYLTSIFSSPQIPSALVPYLSDINRHFSRGFNSSGSSTCDRFITNNFGREKFVKLMDQLLNLLQITLSGYRNHFPASQPDRLNDLKSTVDLVKKVCFFRKNIQQLNDVPQPSFIVKECSLSCIRTTYLMLFENAPPNSGRDTVEPQKSISFWNQLVSFLAVIVDEDAKTYSPLLNQFEIELVLSELTALTLWGYLCEDVKLLLHAHSQHFQWKSSDYMNLCFKVKWFFNRYVIPFTQCPPACEYPQWFEPFLIHWLTENDHINVNFLKAAFERDERDGFQRSSEQAGSSVSVVDVFSMLNQAYQVIKSLECPHEEINGRIHHTFFQTIKKVVEGYIKKLECSCEKYANDDRICCTLMNNIHRCRVLVEHLFISMKGMPLKNITQQGFTELQTFLHDALKRATAHYVKGFAKQFQKTVMEMGKLLHKLKNTSLRPETISFRQSIESDAETVLRPFTNFFDALLSKLSESCEPPVMRRLLKDIWHLTITTIENILVLPPVKELHLSSGVESVGENHLNYYQCQVLDQCLDLICLFFHANGNGLKRNFMERSDELVRLKPILALSAESTDALIKKMVASQQSHDSVGLKDAVGELCLEISIEEQKDSNEINMNVKVLSATKLVWKESNLFRPFVEVHLIGPQLLNRKRRFSTKSRSNTHSPKFDENFVFTLPKCANLENYELQLSVKDYCFGRQDQLIGVTVVRLSSVKRQKSNSFSCPLRRHVLLDKTGLTIQRVLAQRSHDEVARELVRVKSQTRFHQPTS